MKLTKKQLRRLIQEALDRIPIFPKNPVTRQELDQIRGQSRSQAGIDSELQGKLQGLELMGQSEFTDQARELAKAFGSEQGEISEREEEDFLRAQMVHRLLPILEPIFGNELYKFPTRFLELLQKFYETSQTSGEFQVLIYDLGARRFVGDRKEITEDHESILKKLSGTKPEAVLRHAGPATGGLSSEEYYEMQEHFWEHYSPNQTSGHFIFRMAKLFRPDLKIYSAN